MEQPWIDEASRMNPYTYNITMNADTGRKTQVYNPDCMVVLDPTLLSISTLFSGLRPDGILILNYGKSLGEQPDGNLKLAGVIDATRIAIEEIGRDIPNTCLVGAFAAATRWLKLESIVAVLKDYFVGDILDGSIRSAERGFHEVYIREWQ